MNKPEISKEAVIEGKPSFTRTKRVARSMIELGRKAAETSLSLIPGMPAPTPIGEEIERRKLSNELELERRGRTFLLGLRESFGRDVLSQGLVLKPQTGNQHGITVHTLAHDTATAHTTEAVVDIVSKDKNWTRLAVGAVEPTVAAARDGGPADPTGWVQVVNPTGESRRVFSSMDYSLPEQDQLVEVAGQTFGEIIEACDQGNCEVYASPV